MSSTSIERDPTSVTETTEQYLIRNIRLIKGFRPDEQVHATDTLGSDLDLDSLDIIDLVNQVEEDFNCFIDSVTDRIKKSQALTVAQLAAIVDSASESAVD